MNCNKCGTVNPEGTNFCVNCGNNLNSVVTPTPVVPETPELPGLAAQPAPVAPAPVEMPAPAAPAPVEMPAPAAVATPSPAVEEPTGPLLEPITQPQLAPNLLATQVIPTVAPEAPAPVPPMEPVAPAPVAETPVAQPAPVAPTPVAPVQPTPAPAAPTVAPGMPVPKKGMNKKILIPIIAVAAVALIVVALLVVPKILGGSGADDLAKAKTVLDTDRPIPIKEDGKYGFISSKGKVIIEPKYEDVGEFYGDYAVVALENDDDDAWTDYKYQVINQKGKEQLDEAVYLEPEYYPEYGIWVIDGKLYNDRLKQTSAEGEDISYIGQGYLTYSNMEKDKSGIMTASGKKVWSWDGWSIDADLSENDYSDEDLYAIVRSYLDDEQEVILSLKKKKIVYELEDHDNNQISEEDNGVFSIFDTNTYKTHTRMYFYNGKLAYESKDSELEDINIYDYEQQIIQLYYGYDSNYDSVYEYYDAKKGKEVDKSTLEEKNEYEDEDLYELKYGFKPFESSYKYGLMSGDKILVQSKYEDIHFLEYNIFLYMKEVKNKELVLFETEKEMILMNVNNQKEIAKFDADYVGMYSSSSFLKLEQYEDYHDTEKYIVYNVITGEQKEFDGDVNIELGSNYITVEDDGKITYYNTKLESIYTIED
ncbi:MAG: WG repeat-containing protein [Candidatus Coprovivens sp.]